jgi:hypothetical protein
VSAPYFPIAFPDHFYLWKDIAADNLAVDPTYAVDARPILQPYFEQAAIKADEVSGASLELIVASWIGGVMHKSPDALSDSEQWLVDSGLYDAVAGGSLVHEVAV